MPVLACGWFCVSVETLPSTAFFVTGFLRERLFLPEVFLLAACSDPKQALDTWVHADTGSYGAAISPDGKYLLTGDIDGFARVWDLQKN